MKINRYTSETENPFVEGPPQVTEVTRTKDPVQPYVESAREDPMHSYGEPEQFARKRGPGKDFIDKVVGETSSLVSKHKIKEWLCHSQRQMKKKYQENSGDFKKLQKDKAISNLMKCP